jgi:hypothetical protein
VQILRFHSQERLIEKIFILNLPGLACELKFVGKIGDFYLIDVNNLSCKDASKIDILLHFNNYTTKIIEIDNTSIPTTNICY